VAGDRDEQASGLMARSRSGSIRAKQLADGTEAFHLRFFANGDRPTEVLHERRACRCCGGGWNRPRAEIELQNILARVAAGVWQPRRATEPLDRGVTWRFDQYATDWFTRWSAGALGEDRPRESTVTLVRDWVLRKHLLPALGRVPLDDEHMTRERLTDFPAIAAAIGVTVPTVYYHLAKPPPHGGGVGEARALLTLLGYAGPRIGEALALRFRDVRLHAAPRRLDVLDAKTPSGIREVHLSPELAELLIAYRHCRRRDGRPAGDDDCLWTAARGGARSYTWARGTVARAATIASERRAARGLPPLPNVTPHTLRHTYISILLLVTDNVTYAMEQVGHDDQDTTNRIYRHIIRQRQAHGTAFDRVVSEARETLRTACSGGAQTGLKRVQKGPV